MSVLLLHKAVFTWRDNGNTGRNEVALQQAAREIDPTGQRVYAIKMNVANAQTLKQQSKN